METKMVQKKLGDMPREAVRVGDAIVLVARIELLWLNGQQGRVIEHYMAMNQGQVETAALLVAPDAGGAVSNLAAEMVRRLGLAFRATHGAAIMQRSRQIVDDIRAGLIEVLKPLED